MPRRKIILLLSAAVIAVVVMVLARSMMTPQPASTTIVQAEPASQVLGAAHDLPIGSLLKDVDLKWIPWPAEAQGNNLFVKGTTEKTALIGSVLRQSIREDAPFMSSQVVNPHSQGFLAAVLKPGMRAGAIQVTPSGDVAGFIFPGDRVDVILSHAVSRKNSPDLNDRHVSETVLKDVRVLALDQKTDDQASDPKIAQLATLEVTPDQAERLALAGQLGALSLSLRSLAVEDTLLAPPSPDQIQAAGSVKNTQTWDSDISQAFPALGGDDHLLQKSPNHARQGNHRIHFRTP